MDTIIGKVSKINEHEVEWSIEDFFCYTEGSEVRCRSSPFFLMSFRCYFNIYPSGWAIRNAVGWISLYLHVDNADTETALSYSFGIKKSDGNIEVLGHDKNWLFIKERIGFGTHRLIELSTLTERSNNLVPSSVLTISLSLCMSIKSHIDVLSQNFADMFTSKEDCDVTLKVKSEEFPAHKFILSARSSVFKAMLKANMREKNTGVIDIEDCDPEVFKDFLLYVYSGRIENLSDNLYELCKIADKYNVKALKNACILHAMKNLSVENVLDVAILADTYEDEGLMLKSQDYFNTHFKEIICSANWEIMTRKNYFIGNKLLKTMAKNLENITCNAMDEINL